MRRGVKTRPVGELVDAVGGGTPSKKNPSYWSGPIPWVSPKDMKRWEIDDAIDHISDLAIAETSCKLVPAPAVLMVVRGMILAHSVPVALTTTDVAINQDMKALLPREGVDAQYLGLVLAGARDALLSRVDIAGHGTRRLPTEAWSTLPVPFPSVQEQERIVQRALSALEPVEELQALHARRRRDIEELRLSLVLGPSRDSREWFSVGKYFEQSTETEAVRSESEYCFAGAKSFGRGLFSSGVRRSDDFSYARVRRLRAKAFVYPKLMAWEGAFGMVPPSLAGHVVSPEFVTFLPKRQGLSVEVLDTYFRSKHCLDDVRGASTGSNRRRRRLHPDAFLELSVPCPPLDVQARLVEIYALEEKAQQEWSAREGDLSSLRQSVLRTVFEGRL